jgi:hypothetical protein
MDSSGKMLTGEEMNMRNDVFRRAMAGDPAAAQAIQTGDYSAFQAGGTGTSPTATSATRGIGPTGTTGTAQDLMSVRLGPTDYTSGQGLNPTRFSGDTLGLTGRPGGANIFTTASSYGPENFSAAAGGTGATTNYGLSPAATSPELGLSVRPYTMGAADFSRAAGGTGATTNYGLTPASAQAAAQPAGFIDRMVSGAKDFYNENLSPSRPGLPADAGILRKYGPLVAAGTAVAGAAGGFESQPSNPNPAFNRDYTGFDYMRDNPDMFKGGLDRYQPPGTPSPVVVPTPSYASIPVGQPGVVVPMGATRSPGGVAQPYNVAGLYGVPLIYGERPPGYAKGGELRPTEFPRKNGPIDGPGTGTSDSIPAMLSDGEFVFTAKAVRNAGGGSRRKGAARMYKLMKKLEGGPVKAK